MQLMGKPIWVSEKISVMKSTVMMYLFVGWKIMRDVAKVGKRAWCLLIFFKTVHVKSSNLVRYWGGHEASSGMFLHGIITYACVS